MTTQQPAPYPLGQAAAYSGVRDMVAKVEPLEDGTTVLRISRQRPGDRTPLAVAHVVLSPAEVASLLAALDR